MKEVEVTRFGRWAIYHDGRDDKEFGYYLQAPGEGRSGPRGLEVFDAADQLAEQDSMNEGS